MKRAMVDSLKQTAARLDGFAEMADGLLLQFESMSREVGLIVAALETEALATEALKEDEPKPPPGSVPAEKHDICIRRCDGTERYWDEKIHQWVDEKTVTVLPNGEAEPDIF